MAKKASSGATLKQMRREFLKAFAGFLGETSSVVTAQISAVAEFTGLSESFITQVRRGDRNMRQNSVDDICQHLGGSAKHFDWPATVLLDPDAESSEAAKPKKKATKKRSASRKKAPKKSPVAKKNTAKKKTAKKKSAAKTVTKKTTKKSESKKVDSPNSSQTVSASAETEPTMKLSLSDNDSSEDKSVTVVLPSGSSILDVSASLASSVVVIRYE